MQIKYKYFPDDIKRRYKINEIVDKDGFVYVKIKKGMYGLKQAAILAYEQLVHHLAPFGYFPIPNSTGLWKHKTNSITFCLCVDDFGIKYSDKKDLLHLKSTLEKFTQQK